MSRALRLPLRVYRFAFGACVLAVLAFSLAPPGPELPTTGWDKTNHVLAFAVLALLGNWSYPARVRTVLAGLLAYGALIECLQSLTTYRFAEWSDVFADALGLALGWMLGRLAAVVSRIGKGKLPGDSQG